MSDAQACENTDREIWRGPDEGGGDFYADSLHITKGGGLGINCGGTVYVKPIREWHRMAAQLAIARKALEDILSVLDVSVPTDGLLKGKLQMAVGYVGSQMCWTPQNSYEHAVINELGCKVRDARAALKETESKPEDKNLDQSTWGNNHGKFYG